MPRDDESTPDSWAAYQRLVISTLGEHGKSLEAISITVKEIEINMATEIAVLKLKMGMYGVLLGSASGILGTIATILIWGIKLGKG